MRRPGRWTVNFASNLAGFEECFCPSMKRRSRKPSKSAQQWKSNLDEAYKAAVMVTQGETTGQIAVNIFGSKSTACLTRVSSLLKLAEREGLFSLAGQLDVKTAAKLQAWCDNPEMKLHVVKNDHLAYSGNVAVDEAMRADAVARKAAEVVAERIAKLLHKFRHHKNRRIVVANAGGYAVSRIVHFLASHRTVPEETNPRQLDFISLNSASMPTDYGRSANTLAVRMAEIYGGSHIALCPIWPQHIADQYQRAVSNIDLLICGAGSNQSILFTWLRQHAGVNLPDDAVGDICLIPISRDGHEVPLDETSRANLNARVDLQPSYSDLHSLAGRNGVIFVPMGFLSASAPDNPAGSSPEHSKLAVTRAILKHSLAHTCILGNSLAQALIESSEIPAPDA